jgi:hypothetical protein
MIRSLMLVFLFVTSLEVGCAPSTSFIQTAIVETQISLPVSTPSILPAAVVPVETQAPTPNPPVSNSLYIGTVNGEKAIFVTSDRARADYEYHFSSYPYLGKLYFSDGSEFDFNFKDLVDPQLLLTIPENEDQFEVANSGSRVYISGIKHSADSSSPLDSLYVYFVDLETGAYREIWRGQPGFIDKIWDDYLLIELLPCTHCSPSLFREKIILNGITGSIKELGEVGDVSFTAENNSVWYRHLTPIEVPCDPGEGCEDGFYTDYEPSGKYFSETLP